MTTNNTFKNAVNTMGGLAVGAFLVIAVPSMAVATGITGLVSVGSFVEANEAGVGSRDYTKYFNHGVSMFILFLAFVGLDVGLYKLIRAFK